MNEDKFLGKKVEYTSTYDSSLIVPVPRQENRNLINISNNNLPFVGFDIWNAYELSCLDGNGVPFVGIVKIKYPCDSEFIVESKSLKLYLNSFNMTRFNSVTQEQLKEKLSIIISADLSNALKTIVQVNVFDATDYSPYEDVTSDGNWYSIEHNVFINPNLTCTQYNETPSLLLPVREYEVLIDYFTSSRSLRSNCKVTKQPDWGDVYIHYTSYKKISEENLFKYIVSFRNECHFHEEICETIYKRLLDILEPVSLVVACFYTRRGGIDINPIRSMLPADLRYFENYLDIKKISSKKPRQ